ncbi:MAG: hypothetical protein V1492_01710 [Candidatus Micrarchaeota archaeon]
MEIPNIYKMDYRLLAIAPLLLLAISLFFIPQIKLGVDFRGGTLVALDLPNKIDTVTLRDSLAAAGLQGEVRGYETAIGYKAEIEFPQSDALLKAEDLKAKFDKLLPEVTTLEIDSQQNTTKTTEYMEKRKEIEDVAKEMFVVAKMQYDSNVSSVNDIERSFSAAYKNVYSDYQDSIIGPISKNVKYTSISVRTVSPMLSASFIDTALKVGLVSAILCAIFVFLYFRIVIPSIAVIVGAVCDVVIALGAMGLFGIPLTLPSFAALLMLVGFSLDTDVLLTMRMLKRKGDPRDKAYDAMKTGITMSIMAVVSFSTLFLLAYFTHIRTYYEISAVALAGLVGDIFATWGINAVILLWYMEHRKGE